MDMIPSVTVDTPNSPAPSTPGMLTGRRWVAWLLVALVAQTGAVMAFNLVVDPRAEFGTSLYEPLVSDARTRKALDYSHMSPKPETLVFGSSRALTVLPTELEAAGYGRTYNLAIDSGSVLDALVYYMWAHESGATPRQIVLVAEDWAFRSPNKIALREVDAATSAPDLALALLRSVRLDHVQDSFRSLRFHREGFPVREMVIQPDGSVSWERAEAELASGSYDEAKRLALFLEYATKFYEDPGPEPRFVDAFQRLMQAAQENGTRVDLVIPPLAHTTRIHLDAQAYAKSQETTLAVLLAACAPGVRLVDLSDPASSGITDGDLIEGHHPTRAAGKAVTRAIVAAPDRCQQGI